MRKAILLSALLCAACSNYPASLPSIKPYKMDIQQGNVVTPKMMMQLRPGMSKAQVRFVMGTPLIADSFHANRWDYLYRMQKDGKVIEQRRVILDFEDEKLARVRGDVVPAGSGATEPLPGDQPTSKAPVTLKSVNDPAPKKEKGILDKLQFWKNDEEPAPAKPATTPAPAPAAPALPAIRDEAEQPLPPLMDATPEPAAKTVSKPAAEPAPVATPKAEPAPEPKKAEIKPEPKAEAKPAPKPMPRTEPKPVPKPTEDLPTEGDPTYFEKMLEKIGF